MPSWYEVFDDEQVQIQTRRRVRRVLAGLAVTLGALAVFGPFVVAGAEARGLALTVLALLAIAALGVASGWLMRLQRVMWCVKLSVHRIVGFDYARRKTVLSWCEVERVEVDSDGLLVVGAPGHQSSGPVLRIPARYPEFHALSHRATEYAEAHGVPIYVDGRPWQLLDVTRVFPFLDGPPAERPTGGLYFDPRRAK